MLEVHRVLLVPVDGPSHDVYRPVECLSIAEANGALRALCPDDRKMVVVIEWIQDYARLGATMPPLRLPLRPSRSVIDLNNWISSVLSYASMGMEEDHDAIPGVPLAVGLKQIVDMHPWLAELGGAILAAGTGDDCAESASSCGQSGGSTQ